VHQDKPRHSTDLVELRSPILWSALYPFRTHHYAGRNISCHLGLESPTNFSILELIDVVLCRRYAACTSVPTALNLATGMHGCSKSQLSSANTKITNTSFLAFKVLPFEHKTFWPDVFRTIPLNMPLGPMLAGFGITSAVEKALGFPAPADTLSVKARESRQYTHCFSPRDPLTTE
jgi:hypothetical protein